MIKGASLLTMAAVRTLSHMVYDTFVLRPIPGELCEFFRGVPCESFDVALELEQLLYYKEDRVLHTVACSTSKIPSIIGTYIERSILGVDTIPGLWHSGTVKYCDCLSVVQWRTLTQKSTSETNH